MYVYCQQQADNTHENHRNFESNGISNQTRVVKRPKKNKKTLSKENKQFLKSIGLKLKQEK